MEYKTEPLAWENNENTLLQKDQFGSYQNIAYYDADNGMQIGPNDPRASIITQVPVNIFRPQPMSDFDEKVLDDKWQSTLTGSAYITMSNSCAVLGTGLYIGSCAEIVMPVVPMHFVNGMRVYFYLTTDPNGYLDLEFGVRKDATNFVRFKRVEDAVANAYASQCQAGGALNSYSGVGPGNSVRRLFCIDMVGGAVKFYVGTDAGVLELKATHTTSIPSGTGRVYVAIKNRYAANRTVAVDFVCPVRIR